MSIRDTESAAQAAAAVTDALTRLAREDAVGQLRRQAGAMLRLGSENGVPMLDWVEAVPRALANPAQVDAVEQDAHRLLARGIRHIIWAGMGGSVLSVQVLRALGFCDEPLRVYPLDSTDPRALNHLLYELAAAKGMSLPESQPAPTPASASQPASTTGQPERRGRLPAEMPDEDALCRALLADVIMVGVAMGKTSEEPISHLDWFGALVRQGGLPLADHLLIMAIPDSYLEQYARTHGIPGVPLQLDGGAGTPGRMSAPATRVFLLPAALDLAARGAAPGTLRSVLAQAWAAYDLDGAAAHPDQHPFVRLAAALAGTATDGACALALALPSELDALRWWSEQLMEESLGKGGKGIVVFADQSLPAVTPSAISTTASTIRPLSGLRLRIAPAAAPSGTMQALAASADADPASDHYDAMGINTLYTLYQPLLAGAAPADRLAGLAAMMLGLQLCTALYGYLHDIPFAGQPAVEAYKSRARELRAFDNPIQTAASATHQRVEDRIRLLLPPGDAGTVGTPSPVETLAATLTSRPSYLDLTINGELSARDTAALEAHLRELGTTVLGIPVKLRRAPASYHSTEQSEMDGPPGLVSIRALAERSEPILLGRYDAAFLRAQAVGTWFAMHERGRACYLFVYDGTDEELGPALCQFLTALARRLSSSAGDGPA